MNQAPIVVLFYAATAVLPGWLYFSRYTIQRPPVGVFNLWDVTFMVVAIVLIPYLYLALPVWLLAGLLGLGALSILYFTFEPVLRARLLIWLTVIACLAADLGALHWFGPTSSAFWAINNLVQVLAVVGVSNLWVQSGMKARDTALLGAGLIVYDVLFTSLLPLMGDLFNQLDGLPFAPLVAWPVGSSGPLLSVGLGDLLLACVFPLVMRKAYSPGAGLIALAGTLAAFISVLAMPAMGLLKGAFPVMVVLGPLMLIQYYFWHRQLGRERTMWEYYQAEKPILRRPGQAGRS